MSKTEKEYEAGYRAFMLRCMTYAAAHADADDEAWSKHHNFGVDAKPATPSYLEGFDHARERMHREVGMSFGSMQSPREQTKAFEKTYPAYSTIIPLKGEPGYAKYEAERVARNAAHKAAQKAA